MMYERVFQIIKNKIECGLLPAGSSLPSRSNLCEEFGTSEKTIRRVLKMLEENGLIKTQQRRRPVVRYTFNEDTQDNCACTGENRYYDHKGCAESRRNIVLSIDPKWDFPLRQRGSENTAQNFGQYADQECR